MNLIDILVQELPKRGGWPSTYQKAVNDCSGIRFDRHHGTPYKPVWSTGMVDPSCIEEVTLEQYESALAASKHEWDGEGLPPVGTVCEYIKQSLTIKEWTECTIDYVGSSFIVYRDCYGVELAAIKCDIEFRPIRSEADKKRTEAIHIIADLCRDSASNGHSGQLVYDAIAAGKVPGIRIE